MHPDMPLINKILWRFGWQLYRRSNRLVATPKIRKAYAETYKNLKANPPKGFKVASSFLYEGGEHPKNYIDFECEFAARHLSRVRPASVLDIGSYRHFILGLIAHYPVTTIDIRPRESISKNETVITCDAKKLALSDNLFDAVVSLCSLEHFGLGRYGDEIDWDADKKAFREMARVLKSGGRLILSTELARGEPTIVFNTHRVYTRDLILSYADSLGLALEDEAFYSRAKNRGCEFKEVTTDVKHQDVYLGCWIKK